MLENLIDQLKQLPDYAWNLVLAAVAVLSGLLVKGITNLILRFYSKPHEPFSIFKSIIERLNTPLTFFLPLFVLNLVIPAMELTEKQAHILDKLTGIFLIVSLAVVLISVIKIFEDLLYHIYDLNKRDNLRERKIRTQIQFVRKLLITMIVILAIGAVLLSFSSLRRIGTGLLTGVGISGIIVGFAAQRSLGNLLAGLQIAFTQPLRIDDALVVEGEFGKVEEITLTYVVLSLWDQRRLILPINYFLEKPFQNWTRTSSEILGTVFLYLDYSAPFEAIRKEFTRLLEASKLWDRRVGGMQVTDATENTVQVRFLVSAVNSGEAFDLKCYLRENLVSFIQANYPSALPKTRTIVASNEDVANETESWKIDNKPTDNKLRTSHDGRPVMKEGQLR